MKLFVFVVLAACALADLADKDKELLQAASTGNVDEVRRLLKEGAHPNAKFSHEYISWTALQLAAREGHAGVVKVLAENGASLVERDTNGETALHLAVREGRENVVDVLLAKGASPNDAIKPGAATPLYVASRTPHASIVEKLLKAKGNPNTIVGHDAGTTLHAAAREGHGAVIALLAEYGGKLEAQDAYKFTPLLVACSAGQTESVRKLLQLGADIHAKDHLGGGCLFRASQSGHADTVALLLEHNPDVDTVDMGGRSAKDVASERVKKLIADYEEKQRKLATMTTWLSTRNMRDVVDQLKSGGIFNLQQLYATSEEELGRLGIPPRRRQFIHTELHKTGAHNEL